MIALLLACASGVQIDRELTVGCGMCMFGKMSSGCYWAAKIDDRIVGVGGPGVPTEAELPSHGPGGMCAMERKARVVGTLKEDQIIADRFELVPVDVTGAPPAHDHKH